MNTNYDALDMIETLESSTGRLIYTAICLVMVFSIIDCIRPAPRPTVPEPPVPVTPVPEQPVEETPVTRSSAPGHPFLFTATPAPLSRNKRSESFIIPTEGYLMSKFGWRRDPKNGKRAFHTGIDISHWFPNSEVWASADGIVKFIGPNQGYGITVRINHDDGFETMYSHLKLAFPDVGDVVEQGEVIGIMGATGRTTGVHLHFELRKNGEPVNPLDYIKDPTFVTR